jgi:hypothetical protein
LILKSTTVPKVSQGQTMDLFAYIYQTSHGILGLLVFVLDLIAIFSLLMGRRSVTHKLIWILLILLLPFLGMLLYFVFGRTSADA